MLNGQEITTVKDIDGNEYKTVTIGNQVWLAENLKTTKYNDGKDILNTSNVEWDTQTSGAYCWYSNDITNKNKYGGLYNWYSVKTGKLCPTGWHVPSKAEWLKLAKFAGGENIAGGQLKATGNLHWGSIKEVSPSLNFGALPSGERGRGTDGNLGLACTWWSSTKADSERAWSFQIMGHKNDMFESDDYNQNGYSVRCLKD